MIRLAGSPTPLNHGTARVTGLEWVPYRSGQQTADRLTCESRWLKFAPELFLSRHALKQVSAYVSSRYVLRPTAGHSLTF